MPADRTMPRTNLVPTLERATVTATAPCRVDASGTWDLKGLALPYERIVPSTTNIALDMRTSVRLDPYEPGRILVRNDETYEAFPADEVPLDSRFGLVFATVSHVAVDGVAITLAHESPPYAGLGGSGTLVVALLGALRTAAALALREQYDASSDNSRADAVSLAHHLEDGLRYSNSGMQDQAAAAFGGIHRWAWRYADVPPFSRERIVPRKRHGEVARHIAVAYVGAAHDSSDVNAAQIRDFYSGATRPFWFEINDLGHAFADALVSGDYAAAARAIQREHRIRCELVPRRNTPVGMRLEEIARDHGCGFAVSGAGNGGCVWAIGPDEGRVAAMTRAWADALRDVPTGRTLPTKVADDGLFVRVGDS